MRSFYGSIFCFLSAIIILTGCSMDLNESDNTQDNSSMTRSFDQLSAKDFLVSLNDAMDYVEYVSAGKSIRSDINGYDGQKYFNPSEVEVTPYPDDINPSIYILNYKDSWEIISSDKRTDIVLASGKGSFAMDMDNRALTECIKDLAAEVAALHSYSGEIKNALNHYTEWTNAIATGNHIKALRASEPGEYYMWNSATRSSLIDTSYHPVPGHWEIYETSTLLTFTDSIPHLVSTAWGENEPYNQYCPKNADIPSLRAPAGSEAVAGGQMVHFLHYNGDMCPSVYGSAYCDTYFGDNMDWSAMEQFDKSAANWARFQTADSTTMAAILLANIGKKMEMNYGANYSCGTIGNLKQALEDEYDVTSTEMSFAGSSVNPYNEIYDMLQNGKPSIVHSDGGANNTLPHTYIVDRYRTGRKDVVALFTYKPDDPTDHTAYGYAVGVVSRTYPVYFGMNWGRNGAGNNVWVINSSDWYVGSLDYSNRVGLLSFRAEE